MESIPLLTVCISEEIEAKLDEIVVKVSVLDSSNSSPLLLPTSGDAIGPIPLPPPKADPDTRWTNPP